MCVLWIADHPELYRLRPGDYRRINLRVFPYIVRAETLWVLAVALALNMPDFEDAIQAAHAESCGAHLIVTRSTADFTNSQVPANDARGFPGPLRRRRDTVSRKLGHCW